MNLFHRSAFYLNTSLLLVGLCTCGRPDQAGNVEATSLGKILLVQPLPTSLVTATFTTLQPTAEATLSPVSSAPPEATAQDMAVPKRWRGGTELGAQIEITMQVTPQAERSAKVSVTLQSPVAIAKGLSFNFSVPQVVDVQRMGIVSAVDNLEAGRIVTTATVITTTSDLPQQIAFSVSSDDRSVLEDLSIWGGMHNGVLQAIPEPAYDRVRIWPTSTPTATVSPTDVASGQMPFSTSPQQLFDYGATATAIGERRVKLVVWFISNDQLSALRYQIFNDPGIMILSGTAPTQTTLAVSELLTTEFEIQLADDRGQRFGLLITGADATNGGFTGEPIIHLRFWNGELNSILEWHG